MKSIVKLSLVVSLLFALSASANTYTVSNNNDWFFGSLRWAIEDANKNPGPDTIVFAIPGALPIRLETPLPVITGPVTIDGWTQAQWPNPPLIEIDGTRVTGESGLRINAPSVIRGLAINKFGKSGIAIESGGAGTIIHGCFIGLSLDGTSGRPNGGDGISIYADDVIIGGTGAKERNVISYNGGNGIAIGKSAAGYHGKGDRTIVQNNYVGTEKYGMHSRGNSRAGIQIFSGRDVLIGGDTTPTGNVVSGNGEEGIRVNLFETQTGTTVTQYVIRTTVKNNKIGVNVDNTALGNGFFGGSTYAGVEVRAPEAKILQNMIATNNGPGVMVRLKYGTTISNNSIWGNARLGIDLDATYVNSGVTLNDYLDQDTGGNSLLNFPVINVAYNQGNSTYVSGSYQGAPNVNLVLEFYRTDACDSAGYGEGDTLVGTGTVATDNSGNGAFSLALMAQQIAGMYITATVRDGYGSTSEFSQCRTVVGGLPPTVSGLTPGGGRAGTVVTISGSNFNWVNAVKFFNGYTHSANAAFTIVSPTTITATVPNDAKTGSILVSSPYGNASTAPFKVTPPQGDMNSDAKPDLVWRHYGEGTNSIWLNGGENVELLDVPNLDWEMQGTGDFNNDGYHDIVWRNYTTGVNSIWFMTGAHWGGSSVLLPTVPNTNWHINAVGDFDRDGDPDLVWRNYSTGDTSIWKMDGTTWNGAYAALPNVDVDWRIEAAGDFNLDNSTDLLWRNYETGQVSIWHMNDTAWAGQYTMLPSVSDANWIIEGAADWDQDGDMDIIWRNPTTGQNSVWLLIGAYWNGTSYVLLGTVEDSNWRVEDY